MRRLTLISAVSACALMLGCSQAEEEEAPPPAPESTAEDLAAHVGAALVTQPDGTVILTYSTADGTTYGGPVVGPEPATWSVEGDVACVTPPVDEKICFTYGPAGDDGSIPVIGEDGSQIGTMTPFGASVAPGTTPAFEAGSALAQPAEGDPFLTVWTADGRAYRADNPQQGTWRAVDGKRCGTGPNQPEEGCATPGPMGDDGTFQATTDDGQVVTVRFLD